MAKNTIRKAKFSGHDVIMWETLDGERRWKMRSVGAALGYSSDGGNFSHMLSQGWGELLVEGLDYDLAPSNPVEGSGHTGTVWLTDVGLQRSLQLAMRLHNRRDVAKFAAWVAGVASFALDREKRPVAGVAKTRQRSTPTSARTGRKAG